MCDPTNDPVKCDDFSAREPLSILQKGNESEENCQASQPTERATEKSSPNASNSQNPIPGDVNNDIAHLHPEFRLVKGLSHPTMEASNDALEAILALARIFLHGTLVFGGVLGTFGQPTR